MSKDYENTGADSTAIRAANLGGHRAPTGTTRHRIPSWDHHRYPSTRQKRPKALVFPPPPTLSGERLWGVVGSRGTALRADPRGDGGPPDLGREIGAGLQATAARKPVTIEPSFMA